MRVLLHLVREKNVSRVAERLEISQQAVSNCLKRMREVFPYELFLRQSAGLQPTDYAYELAAKFEKIIEEVDGIFNSFPFDPVTSDYVFRVIANEYAQLSIIPSLTARKNKAGFSRPVRVASPEQAPKGPTIAPVMCIMTTASVQARDPLAAHRHRGPKTKGRRRRSGRWGLGWSCSPPTGGAAALEPRWRLAGRRPRGSDRASSWPARCRSTGGPVGGAPSWTENKRAAAAVRAMGAWLVLLAADRRSRCPRAALAAGGAALSWERSCKLMACSMPIGWRAGWQGPS